MTAIDTLIRDLEGETEGSRELDANIWMTSVPGTTRKQWSYIHKASGKECFIDETREASGALIVVPHYTTSLDAKVPGENIVEMNRDEDKWYAWHESKLGKLFMGAAYTEILARRIAGLRGIMAAAEKETKR